MGAEFAELPPPQPWRKEAQLARDPFREVPLRYLGYANEVGEAFRHMVGVRWVYLTYLVSSSYVAAHALQQGVRASRPTSPHGGIIKTSHESHVTKMSPSGAVVDTLVWQGLASVVVPGFTINRVCALSRLLLRQRVFQRQMAMSPALQRWTVTAVGLGCIPFIIQPIDR
jgi:fission process protein 1